MYKRAFERLPERFRKTNTEKLYYVLYNDSKDLKQAFDSVRDSRNIDKAEGQTLDLIGANVGQFRIDEDDELYRLLIKTRIIANLSKGDIPTINQVSSVLMKEMFLGLEEVWSSGYFPEPAAFSLKLDNEIKQIPYELIKRIKSAGVKVFFQFSYEHNLSFGMYGQQSRHSTMLPADFITDYRNDMYFSYYPIITRLIKTKAINPPIEDIAGINELNYGMHAIRTIKYITTQIKE